MSLRSVVPPILLWVLLTLAILAGNRELLFSTEMHETGDFAVNALQIDQAKHFAEIYGNYSRFHFHHPGPVFFYAYAMSEHLLFDGLALVPSPANAHIAAGMALQCGFFVLALVLLGDVLRVRPASADQEAERHGRSGATRNRPASDPAWVVGLLIGALYFGFTKNAITGIWPPEVLLMPFLAFVAAAVSVASGRVGRLPWMVLAGSFLVHGHVAQPLFVVGIAIFAYGHVVRAEGRRPWTAAVRNIIQRHRPAHILGAAIMLLFLVPLGIDLARGGENFRAILLHLHGNGGGGKNLVQSALYFLTFVTHAQAPEALLETLGSQSLRFISANPLLFILWLLSLGIFAFGAIRSAADDPDARGLRLLWRFWWVTVLLCLVWGLLQEGPMFAFNGYFYHGLHFLVYLGAAIVLVRRWRIPLPRRAAAPLALAAIALAFLLIRIADDRVDHGGLQLRDSTRRVLALDPRPDQPKLLVFGHDYWSHALSVALALRREGVPFRFEPEMEFMAQSRYTAARNELTRVDPPFSTWWFVDADRSATGPLIEHGRGIAFEPAELAPDGVIQFGAENGFIGYQLSGISGGENGRSWTTDPEVVLQFQPLPASSDVLLRLEARPYTHPRGPKQQRLEIRFNGARIWQGALAAEDVIEARIPQAAWNERDIAHLWLHLPDAIAPVEFGNSGDWRVLGLEMTRIVFREAERSPATSSR